MNRRPVHAVAVAWLRVSRSPGGRWRRPHPPRVNTALQFQVLVP